MADLGTILINGDPSNQTTNWTTYTTGDYVNLDEGISSADGTEEGDDSNSTGDYIFYGTLQNMPSDLASMDTILCQIRHRVTGAQTNWRGVHVRIETDEATPVALTAEYSFYAGTSAGTSISNTTLQNDGPQSLTIQGTPTKSQWDNAVVRVRISVNKQKGGDSNGYRLDTLEFTGTYTEAGPTGSGSISLGSLVPSGSGTSKSTATGSITLGSLVPDGAGTYAPLGSGAITLGGLVPSGAGTSKSTGTGAITLGALAPSGSGISSSTGTGSITLGALVPDGAGTSASTGSGSITLGSLVPDGSGILTTGGGDYTGSGSITLGGLVPSGAGVLAISGSGSVSLAALVPSGTGISSSTGSGGIVLGSLAPAGTGTLAISGAGSLVLGGLTITGAGTYSGVPSVPSAFRSVVEVRPFGAYLRTSLFGSDIELEQYE